MSVTPNDNVCNAERHMSVTPKRIGARQNVEGTESVQRKRSDRTSGATE
jgi:hypothetical protein